PGVKIRPERMCACSWTWKPIGRIPRTARLSRLPPGLGMRICSASSGEASGFPDVPSRIPGRNFMASNWSRRMEEPVSVVDPLVSTIRLSSEPLCWMASESPATMAITTTNTATTSAIPAPVMLFETRRTSRLRRLYLSGMAISVHHPQRVHDLAPCCSPRRDVRAYKADQQRSQNRLNNNGGRDLHGSDERPQHVRGGGEYFQQSERRPAAE